MAVKTKIVSRYDYEAQKLVAPVVFFDPKDPKSKSVTNQSDLDSTDINKIMARYEKTGLLTDEITGLTRKPMYGDFTSVSNFYDLQVKIKNVERAFGLLPAPVRSRFDNDPQKLINFLADSKNDGEAVKLGLKNAPPAPDPAPANNRAPGSVPPAPAAPAPGPGA